MIDTIISIELEHRARQKALDHKTMIEGINAMGLLTKMLMESKEYHTKEYERIMKDILDYKERKHRTESAYERGLITYKEAEHLIEHDAVDTFFEENS